MTKRTKFVLVTGSAGGIGSEVVKNLRDNEFKTIGIDTISENDSDFFIKADLLDAVEKPKKFKEILHAIDEVTEDHEFVGLVNNAAIQKCAEISELGSNDYIKAININFLAPVIITKHFIKKLKIANGFVINILSIHTNLSKSGFSSYSASKSALNSFTKSLSIEFGEEFIVLTTNSIRKDSTTDTGRTVYQGEFKYDGDVITSARIDYIAQVSHGEEYGWGIINKEGKTVPHPDSASSWQSTFMTPGETLYEYEIGMDTPGEITGDYSTVTSFGMGRFFYDGWENNPFASDLI